MMLLLLGDDKLAKLSKSLKISCCCLDLGLWPLTLIGSTLAVVECLTPDRGAVGLSLTGVTALWP